MDDRVPVRFGPAENNEAVLVEGDANAPPGNAVARFHLSPGRQGHPAFCACCVPRNPVAEALLRLFLARVRGEVAWFSGVAVHASPAGEDLVRAALAPDQVSAGRFRLAER